MLRHNDCEASDRIAVTGKGWIVGGKEFVPFEGATPSPDGKMWICRRPAGFVMWDESSCGTKAAPTPPFRSKGNFPQDRVKPRNSGKAVLRRTSTLAVGRGKPTNGRHDVKPYFLMLLIGAIVALSDLVERSRETKREHGRVALIFAAVQRIGSMHPQRRLP